MVFSSLSATVLGQGLTAATDTGGSTFLWIAMLAGLLGLVFALFLARSVLAFDTGTAEMRLISNAIREGAEAFMSRQYTTIAALAVVLAIALFVGYKFSDFTAPLAGKVVISFLIGAICSGFAGYTGMFVSIRTNIRAASAARSSLGKALKHSRCTAVRSPAWWSSAYRCSEWAASSSFLADWRTRNTFLTSWSALALALRWWRSSPNWAVASTPRLPT